MGGKFLQAYVGNCPLEDLGKSTKSAISANLQRVGDLRKFGGNHACRFQEICS